MGGWTEVWTEQSFGLIVESDVKYKIVDDPLRGWSRDEEDEWTTVLP